MRTRLIQASAALYEHLGAEFRPRRYLLAALASSPAVESLETLANLLTTDPPPEALDASVAMAPLFQLPEIDASALFPALLDALSHLQVAPAVLDLANYLTRSGRVAAHPATDETQRLTALLTGICRRLRDLEQPDGHAEVPIAKSQRQVSDSVAIACSLCDALGLIGRAEVKPALHDALRLRHRRIRVEAAAALARMGDDEGVAALAELVAHPIARLRVVAYAEELGLIDHLDEQWQTPAAMAEAELATHLALPNNLGAAPTEIELLDQQTLAWPSYDEPQECFQFRFVYRLGDAEYENVAMAGPFVHAFQVDLLPLSIDDRYALFAGFQAEHSDIHEVPAAAFNEAHQVIVRKIIDRVAGEGIEVAQAVSLGVFFGEIILIGTARKDDLPGAIAAGMDDAVWFPHDGSSPRPLGPDEAWAAWKGRRLLQAFNNK